MRQKAVLHFHYYQRRNRKAVYARNSTDQLTSESGTSSCSSTLVLGPFCHEFILLLSVLCTIIM